MLATLLALALLSPAPQSDGLALRSAELPRAEVGAHAGWRDAPLPPLHDLAVAAYRRGDAPAAIELLVVLLERDSDLPPATLLLGGMYFRLRRYEDAVDAYGRFLTHEPREVERTRHLGHALYSLGRYGEARDHYRHVLARTAATGGLAGSARALTLRGLGLALHRLGDLEGADVTLTEALSLLPDDAPTRLARAQVKGELERTDEALADARRARALDPYDARAAFVLGTLLEDAGDGAAAGPHFVAFERLAPVATLVDDLELRLLHRPGDREALAELARLHASVGDLGGVGRALSRLGPSTLEARALAAGLLVDLDPPAAEAAARALEAGHAGEPAAWDALALYRDGRGEAEAAAAARRRAAALRAAADDR